MIGGAPNLVVQGAEDVEARLRASLSVGLRFPA